MEKTESQAAFKSIILGDGRMVAAIVAVPSGPARFFVVQKRESSEAFIGRVSQWMHSAGATGLAMLEPDLLPDGIEVGEVLLRIKAALGVARDAPEAPDYEVTNAELVLGGKPADRS